MDPVACTSADTVVGANIDGRRQVIRPRGAATRRREDEEQSGPSAQEIGQLLRTARLERGLDLLAVHDRLSRPITHIEALENGDLERLPDREAAVSTIRRYATFLGLDGGALATQLGEAWTTAQKDGAFQTEDDTGVVPTSPKPGAKPSGSTTSRVVPAESAPDHLRAFTQTGEVPRFGVAPRPTTGNGAGPPTGTFPVLPRQDLRQGRRALARARRRLRAPTWLRVLTWLAAFCVLVVAAGWAVRTWNPEWLVQAHILRTTQRQATTPAPAPSPTSHQKSAVEPVAAGTASAAFLVRTADFTVTVATTGRCWIEVTSSGSSVPLLEGVQGANQVFHYKATGTMTVIVGASPVLVGVTVDGKNAYLNKPSVTPFTYTFLPPKGG
jgi:Helix-turn-helix domain